VSSSTLKRAGRGALAGAVATVPMSLLMVAAQRMGALGKAPPRKINERLLAVVGRVWPHRSRRRAVSAASHFAFGAAAGALFALAARRVASRAGRVSSGMAYGAAIWGAMYGGLLPALGLMPRPARDRPGRPATMVAAHLVYGAALGALTGGSRPNP
jgi:hypothetical protein